MSNALGPCLKGPLDVNDFIAKADAKAASGAIDPLRFVSRQKVYIFHGYNDAVVAPAVTPAPALVRPAVRPLRLVRRLFRPAISRG